MTKAPTDLHRSPVPGQEAGCPLPARDLVDFHLRWREFRPLAQGILQHDRLTKAESETLRALIELADRVRDEDLA